MYNPKIHHRKSIRLKEYDYTNPNWYYITICTNNKKHLFGEIINNKVILSEFGEIVNECWSDIPKHFEFAELDDFVIMPNHTHGIIIINSRDKACLVPTDEYRKFGKPPASSLSSIIGSFKSAATRKINIARSSPGKIVWQRNYFEHIIRNDDDLFRIRTYIQNNPLRWALDEYY
jgi:REP element-mobilizing transposase RayT